MIKRYLITVFVILTFCEASICFEWQIEELGLLPGRPDYWCLSNVGGAPAVLFFGEAEYIDDNWEWPINYAIHTSNGWEIETVVPAFEKPPSTNLCLTGLPSGNPAICYHTPGHVWFSTKTAGGWQKEEVGDVHDHPGGLYGLFIKNDGTPVIAEGASLGAWYKNESEWRHIRPWQIAAPGSHFYGWDYDLTTKGRLVAAGDFWLPIEGIGGEYGCAMAIGSDWTFFKRGAFDTRAQIKAFDDEHLGIAYAKTWPEGSGGSPPERQGLYYVYEYGFEWEQETIESPIENRRYNSLDLISLPNGEPAIAYTYRDYGEQNISYLKYAWRENGEWLSDTILTEDLSLNPVALELINELPYIAFYSWNARDICVAVPEPATVLLLGLGAAVLLRLRSN